MTHDAHVLLTLLAHCQVTALPVNNADLPLSAFQAGVVQSDLLLLWDLSGTFLRALSFADLVDVSFEYLVLSVVVADFLLFLQLLLELLLLSKGDVFFV